jgi:hypothetical protein
LKTARVTGGIDAVQPGGLKMIPAQEQQMMTYLTVISQDIKTLVALVKELKLQEDTADQKAYTQLVNIAHKR